MGYQVYAVLTVGVCGEEEEESLELLERRLEQLRAAQVRG